MGKGSGIAWTDHTFNPWWGCVKVSPACDNCYAEAWDARFADEGQAHWGKDAARKFFGEKHWNEPLKWNRDARKAHNTVAAPGVPRKQRTLVFCASMADVFESGREDLTAWRFKLWSTIVQTPYLTWLLLTKRPQNIKRMLPEELAGAPNIWLGTTIESPEYVWRAETLVTENPRASARFVSAEPLVASIAAEIEPYLFPGGIDWLISGCESGAGARSTPTDWYRELLRRCTAKGARFFLKQAPRETDGITSGPGSWLKLRDGIIEQPYLDGVQHVAWPV